MTAPTGKPPLLVVVGPTASGKTAMAIHLAKCFSGEVVSGDAFQVYREMSIGTAKPSHEEMQEIPHHLIGILSVAESYNMGRYLNDAKKVVGDVYSRGKLPIICGGTGLYISSFIDGIQLSETSSLPEYRERLIAEAAKNGNAVLHKRLMEVDPELAGTLHPNNVGRIIRALEVFEATGRTQSEHHVRSKPPEPDFDICIIGLTAYDRTFLYERINRRVDLMMEAGLLDEVRALESIGCSKAASQAIGYKELLPYLYGKQDLSSCMESLKQATRRYAKRQLTWFRRDNRIHWFYIDHFANDVLQEQVARTVQSYPFLSLYNKCI